MDVYQRLQSRYIEAKIFLGIATTCNIVSLTFFSWAMFSILTLFCTVYATTQYQDTVLLCARGVILIVTETHGQFEGRLPNSVPFLVFLVVAHHKCNRETWETRCTIKLVESRSQKGQPKRFFGRTTIYYMYVVLVCGGAGFLGGLLNVCSILLWYHTQRQILKKSAEPQNTANRDS